MHSRNIVAAALSLDVFFTGCDRVAELAGWKTSKAWDGNGNSFTIIDSTNNVIRDSVTWTTVGSPYRITDEVLIDNGGRLTIEHGVDVVFDTNAIIWVHGDLRALGTETDSVRFLSGTAAKWGGIWFHGGTSTMHYVRISSADVKDWERIQGVAIESLIASGVSVRPRIRPGGGGITAQGKNCLINLSHVVFSGNKASGEGGGLYVGDGATAHLNYCTMDDNHADFGGALHVYAVADEKTSATLEHCIISANSANSGGGAMSLRGSECVLSLSRCIIVGNKHTDEGYSDWGRTIDVWSGSLSIVHCTIYGNFSSINGSAIGDASYSTIINSVIWNNSPRPLTSRSSIYDLRISYCDISDERFIDSERPRIGNFSADPMFVDVDNRDFAPQHDSPLINAGDPSSPRDADGSIADVGAMPYLQEF